MQDFLWTGSRHTVHSPDGEEEPAPGWVASSEGSQREQSSPLSAVVRRYIAAPRTKDPADTHQPSVCWLGKMALHWNWGIGAGSFKFRASVNPSQVPGRNRKLWNGTNGTHRPLVQVPHCGSSLNTVVWVIWSGEERLGCQYFSPHHQKVGASENRKQAHCGGWTRLYQTMPLFAW